MIGVRQGLPMLRGVVALGIGLIRGGQRRLGRIRGGEAIHRHQVVGDDYVITGHIKSRVYQVRRGASCIIIRRRPFRPCLRFLRPVVLPIIEIILCRINRKRGADINNIRYVGRQMDHVVN